MIFIKRLAIIDIGSKVLCILLLVLNCALLDAFFIKFDEGNMGRYVWIAADIVVVIVWIIGLILVSRNATPQREPAEEKRGAANCWRAFVNELQFAYFSWLLYSLVVVAKVWYMFGDFAESTFSNTGYYNFTIGAKGTVVKFDSTIYSSTSVKITLSLAGPIFLLLAYSHHDEIHNSRYKLLIEKLGTMASLDVLDSLMLLGLLFVNDTRILLPFGVDHAIKFFTCCCFVLPTLPLFVLRLIGNRKTEENNFKIILVLNAALYLILVNVPFLCIRCFLWFNHDIDISTFITKNVMSLFRGALDVYNEVRQWLKARQGGSSGDGTEPAETSIELSTKPTAI